MADRARSGPRPGWRFRARPRRGEERGGIPATLVEPGRGSFNAIAADSASASPVVAAASGHSENRTPLRNGPSAVK